MFGIGMPEMILILAVALIVIGPKKLPDLAKSLGKAMGEFRKATSEIKDSFEIDDEIEAVKTSLNSFKDVHSSIPGNEETELAVEKTEQETEQPGDAGHTGKEQRNVNK